MRKTFLALTVIATVAASYAVGRLQQRAQTTSTGGRHVMYYVDPMHPSYRSGKPGIAPDCGMRLKPVFDEDAAEVLPSSVPELTPGAVSIDSETRHLIGIKVATAVRTRVSRNIRVVGRVLAEDTRVYRVNSGVDGFIRETFNDAVGTLVKKDEKLATYFSPDFLPVASGFLAASERVPGSTGSDGARTVPFPGAVAKQGVSNLQGYADRLRNLGMSDTQIKAIADSRKLPVSIDVVAPVAGFVLARSVSPGQHFMHDMEFYRIGDLSQVWVVAEVSEREAPFLRPGGQARVNLRAQGRQLPARITGSLPQSEGGGGTVKLRLEADNPAFALRPEMLVDVEFPVLLPEAVMVPLDALIESGTQVRVYVERDENIFEPREVQTGFRTGDGAEILHGLQPGERVVAAATFLVDSESRLKAAPGSSRALEANGKRR